MGSGQPVARAASRCTRTRTGSAAACGSTSTAPAARRRSCGRWRASRPTSPRSRSLRDRWTSPRRSSSSAPRAWRRATRLSMPIFTGSKLFKGIALVEGRGPLETALGSVNAVRVRMRTEFSGKLSAREVRMWFSDDEAHVPMRMEADFALGPVVVEWTDYKPGRPHRPAPRSLAASRHPGACPRSPSSSSPRSPPLPGSCRCPRWRRSGPGSRWSRWPRPGSGRPAASARDFRPTSPLPPRCSRRTSRRCGARGAASSRCASTAKAGWSSPAPPRAAGPPGRWPDPLLPVHRAAGGTNPAVLPARSTAARPLVLYLEVCVPAGLEPGTYRGQLVVGQRDASRSRSPSRSRSRRWTSPPPPASGTPGASGCTSSRTASA